MVSNFMLTGLQMENLEVLDETLGRILDAQTTCWLQKTDGKSRKSRVEGGLSSEHQVAWL